jgi:hypothetical protein
MTIAIPTPTGGTLEAQLEEDGFHMLWLINRNRRNSGREQILLSAALQGGWSIVRVSAEEQAVLEAHGFGRRGCNEADRCPMLSEVAMSPPAPGARR